MQNYVITEKEIKELEALTGAKITTLKANKYLFVSKAGKEYTQTAYDLLEKLKYQRSIKAKLTQEPNFKLSKQANKKLKDKTWKSVSVSMTLDEIEILKFIRDKNCYNSLNEMFRDILLKVISANK